jgi:hypothetical protein
VQLTKEKKKQQKKAAQNEKKNTAFVAQQLKRALREEVLTLE